MQTIKFHAQGVAMLLTMKVLAIAVAGTAPIILAWALGRRRWLLPSILLSIALAVGFGKPLYHVIDLAAVAVVGLLAYVSLRAGEGYAEGGKECS
jgi:hypothetical protein